MHMNMDWITDEINSVGKMFIFTITLVLYTCFWVLGVLYGSWRAGGVGWLMSDICIQYTNNYRARRSIFVYHIPYVPIMLLSVTAFSRCPLPQW